MRNISFSTKNLYLILMLLTINFKLSDSIILDMEIKINEDYLNSFNIKSNDTCHGWTPSLLSPILLTDPNKEFENNDDELIIINNIKPYFKRIKRTQNSFSAVIYDFKIFNNFNAILGKSTSEIIDKCYIGLSSGNCNYEELRNNFLLLDRLKSNGEIKNKIFSFDKWNIIGNLIKSYLYFGYSHEHFKSNKENGIIASCKTNNSEPFWGCYFDKISFNGNEEYLKNDTHKFKIYFSSENHEILIPKSFEEKFMNLTERKCIYKNDSYDTLDYFLTCENFFNDIDNIALFNLTNENMIITVEIDSMAKYTTDVNNKEKSRIRFEDIDFFIFPLIMFKNFHIEFNKEKELISFYTKDSSILQVLKKDKKENGKGTSGTKIFLIIFIILMILAIAYGVFWFIKKRKSSVEKNINKYNKFDEDENFQNMNQKVF